MCVIIACPPKNTPNFLTLAAAASANSDGIGMAWVSAEKTVDWRKGLKLNELVRLLDEVGDSTPRVIHFRFATVGGCTAGLCHPFPISATADTAERGSSTGAVLFHNGHVGGWERLADSFGISLTGQVSDSRVIAAVAAATNKGPNWTDLMLDKLAAGGWNRFAKLTPQGFSLHGPWVSRHGLHFSNLNF